MDADLRAALEKLVTAPGAMATDPDGECYFCESDEDVGGDAEHEEWCLVPIARAALAAPVVTEPDLRAEVIHATETALHRWRHPTYRLGEQGCRCHSDAVTAVEIVEKETL